MKKRVFVAVDISGESRRNTLGYIKNLRAKFPDARAGWDKPEKLHLTLKFLGEIDEWQLARLIEAVKKSTQDFSPFKLQIVGTGVFPSSRQARVLWLGVKDEQGNLCKLNSILEDECEKQGFEKEKRNFKAHLTIARLKERANNLVENHLKQEFVSEEFEVSEVVIYQSELRPMGSIYSVISKHKFSEGLENL